MFTDWQICQTCPPCRQTFTTIARSVQGDKEVHEDDLYHPWNASPDRVTPAKDGGSYWDLKNREMVSVSCFVALRTPLQPLMHSLRTTLYVSCAGHAMR